MKLSAEGFGGWKEANFEPEDAVIHSIAIPQKNPKKSVGTQLRTQLAGSFLEEIGRHCRHFKGGDPDLHTGRGGILSLRFVKPMATSPGF